MEEIVQLLQKNAVLDAELKDALQTGEQRLQASCQMAQLLGAHHLKMRALGLGTPSEQIKAENAVNEGTEAAHPDKMRL